MFIKMSKSRNSSRKYLCGVTLIEIIVSTLIMSLVMVGLANLYVVAKRYILHSRSRMAGGELGKYFLDPLQMHVRQDNWNQANNSLSVGSYTGTNSTLDNINYTPHYNITNITNTSLRRVRVNITWNETSP